MMGRYEDWRVYGRVWVNRNIKGRFVHWHVVKEAPLQRQVAVYGKVVLRGEYKAKSRRYQFYGGTGKQLYRAVVLAHRLPPKKSFVTVSTRKFLGNPYRYGAKGDWFIVEVES